MRINCRLSPVRCGNLIITLLPIDCGSLFIFCSLLYTLYRRTRNGSVDQGDTLCLHLSAANAEIYMHQNLEAHSHFPQGWRQYIPLASNKSLSGPATSRTSCSQPGDWSSTVQTSVVTFCSHFLENYVSYLADPLALPGDAVQKPLWFVDVVRPPLSIYFVKHSHF